MNDQFQDGSYEDQAVKGLSRWRSLSTVASLNELKKTLKAMKKTDILKSIANTCLTESNSKHDIPILLN